MRKILIAFLLLLPLAQPAYGTVTSVTRLTDHVGSGQTSFTIGFGFLDEAHLLLTDYTGDCGSATYTDLTLTTNYTIERTSAENGTATVPGTVATGHCLRIQRIVPFTQEIPFRTQGRFSPAAHENAFDQLTHGLQQLTTDVVQSADTAVAIQAHIVSADDHTAYARLAGRAGGQTLHGGTGSGNDLILMSTAHATPGYIYLGTNSWYAEASGNLYINNLLYSGNDLSVADDAWIAGEIYGSTLTDGDMTIESTSHATKGSIIIAAILTVDDDAAVQGVGINTAAVAGVDLTLNQEIMTPKVIGSAASGGDLTLESTSHGTKGDIILGTASAYEQDDDQLGLGTLAPAYKLHVVGDAIVTTDLTVGNDLAVTAALTVDTTTLVVDDINNRVGVNIASPTANLHVVGTGLFTGQLTIPSLVLSGSLDVGGGLTVTTDIEIGGALVVDTIYGGKNSGDDITLNTTTDGAKGDILMGTSAYEEDDNQLGIGTVNPTEELHVVGDGLFTADVYVNGEVYGSDTTGENLDLRPNSADATGYTTFSATCAYVAAVDALYLGSIDPKYTGRLNVKDADNGDHAAHFHNDNDNLLAYGIRIDAGLNAPGAPAADVTWVSMGDGDRTPVSVIRRTAAGGGTGAEFAAASDVRLKKNIGPTDVQGLEVINGLPVRQFDWKDGSGHIPIGYVAQEVEEVWPAMVSTNHETGYLWVGDSSLGPVLVKAVQELSAQVEALEEQVTELQANNDRINELEHRLNLLECQP